MKTFIRISFLLAVCLAVASCSSTQKITIVGTPGTEILKHDYTKIGDIPSSGQLQLKLKTKNYYCPFLLSHNPETGQYVPFAINYQYKNYKAKLATEYAFCFVVIGWPMFLNDMMKTTMGYNFKYLDTQKTNDKFAFTAYDNTGERRTVGAAAGVAVPTGGDAAASMGAEPYSMARPRTSKAVRTLGDYGKAVAGTYRGTGKLRQGDNVIESYTGMTVTLERIGRNTVAVNVVDGNGEPFFGRADTYGIKKGSGQGYSLTLNGIPSATISVDGNGKLVYLHPKVSIEGEIYTLEISASKE